MSWFWLIAFSLVVFVVARNTIFSRRDAPLPPGPPADPFIGHLRSMPTKSQELYFYRLGLKYGSVIHFKVLNQHLVVLNSVQAAVDLLDKRGAIYSDRPDFPIYDLFGMANTLGFEKYGPEWRKQRTMVQQFFSKEKSKDFRPIQTRESRFLALNFLTTSEDKLKLLFRFSTSVIIDINYGHRIESSDDIYIKIANKCSELAAESGPPGATPIDLFPFLRHLPSWFPGTYYATFARNASPYMLKLCEYPYHRMKEQLAKGTAKPCFLASMMEDLTEEDEKVEMNVKRIQGATAAAYIAGADTSSATLSFFLLAMVLHPEYQTKAQEEIDRVIGTGRLPEFDDRESLPYVEGILQETMRWYQPVPNGVPHKVMEDDIYDGMLIPKGSIIIPNVRAMTLDESMYKDPFKFDPERYLPSPKGRGEPYPTGQFGFGRRICPGRHLAEDGAWIAIATILATMKILRTIGEDGKEIVPEESVVTAGLASHPKHFTCEAKPRSKATFEMLQRTVDGY